MTEQTAVTPNRLLSLCLLFVEHTEDHSFLCTCAAGETTDLFLELLAFLRGQGVCFGDQGDDVDFLMQPFHELNVQGLQSAGRKKETDPL